MEFVDYAEQALEAAMWLLHSEPGPVPGVSAELLGVARSACTEAPLAAFAVRLMAVNRGLESLTGSPRRTLAELRLN